MIAERPTPGTGRPGLPADHPKARFVRLLGDREALLRFSQAAEILAPGDPLTVLRLFFFEIGVAAPAATNAADWLREWLRRGARVEPAGLAAPAAGDLWVQTGQDRTPEQVGFVQKVSTDGTWFYAIDGGPERYQVPVGSVDFWVKLPG
jgi:hypothetical protein